MAKRSAGEASAFACGIMVAAVFYNIVDGFYTSALIAVGLLVLNGLLWLSLRRGQDG